MGLGVGFEVRRQIAVLEQGGTVVQETRGWNEQKESSYLMRVKESENDYRYFPDPDLVPMVFEENYIEGLRNALPELPVAKQRRYRADLGLSAYDAGVLCADVEWSKAFEACVALGADPKLACNWMNGELARFLKENAKKLEESLVKPEHIVDIINLVTSGVINGNTAKSVFAETFKSGRMPSDLVKESGATQITDVSAVEGFVNEVISAHPDVVAKYRSGQTNVLGFLVGQVMRLSGGRAKPDIVNVAMREGLEKA